MNCQKDKRERHLGLIEAGPVASPLKRGTSCEAEPIHLSVFRRAMG